MSTDSSPDVVVRGQHVGLRPLRRDLATTYARWFNHADVRHAIEYLGIATPQSEEAAVDDAARAAAGREPKSVAFTIYDLRDGRPIGQASLFAMSFLHGRATL